MRKAFLLAIISSLIILPFGNVLAYGTDYRYTGKPFDPTTNLYYYGQRYYDPNIGRFIQPDPLQNYLTDPQKLKQTTGQDLQKFLENPQALNAYSYTQNNPVRYTDPKGEYIDEVADPLFITESYKNMLSKQTTWNQIAFGADLALLIIPFVPAVAHKAVNLVEGLKVAKIFKNVESLKNTKNLANFSSKEQLLENFMKHKSSFGKNLGLKDFADKAQDLYSRFLSKNENVLSGKKGNDLVLFDQGTHEFSIITPDRVIKSFYIPGAKDKLSYFLRNIDK